MSERMLYLNGIDGETGDYLVSPLSIEAAARSAAPGPADPSMQAWKERASVIGDFQLPFDVDPRRIDQAGWGIVFPEGTAGDVKAALAPLVEHRRSKVPDDIFKVLDYKAGESSRAWLARHGITGGDVDPATVPYYLLLAGDPSAIPFSFQYLLGLDYAVGRLSFETAAEYAAYAKSVVDYETAAAVAARKSMIYWGPRAEGDPATTMSADMLLSPLFQGLPAVDTRAAQPAVAQKLGFDTRALVGKDAGTKAALSDVLHGRSGYRPAMLFTASHGMGFSADNPQQPFRQGALVTQDWPGRGAPRPEHYLAASDIADDADLHGLVAFCFACYGAGTPDRESFLLRSGQVPAVIAPRPFVAPLPRRLLAHPRGGALAVVGHVERAWGYSIQGDNLGPQLSPFRNTIGGVLSGVPVGHATRGFRDRYATASASLLSSMDPSGAATSKLSDDDLVLRWIERNDAQSYVVLGDPAVSVRVSELGG